MYWSRNFLGRYGHIFCMGKTTELTLIVTVTFIYVCWYSFNQFPFLTALPVTGFFFKSLVIYNIFKWKMYYENKKFQILQVKYFGQLYYFLTLGANFFLCISLVKHNKPLWLPRHTAEKCCPRPLLSSSLYFTYLKKRPLCLSFNILS